MGRKLSGDAVIKPEPTKPPAAVAVSGSTVSNVGPPPSGGAVKAAMAGLRKTSLPSTPEVQVPAPKVAAAVKEPAAPLAV